MGEPKNIRKKEKNYKVSSKLYDYHSNELEMIQIWAILHSALFKISQSYK